MGESLKEVVIHGIVLIVSIMVYQESVLYRIRGGYPNLAVPIVFCTRLIAGRCNVEVSLVGRCNVDHWWVVCPKLYSGQALGLNLVRYWWLPFCGYVNSVGSLAPNISHTRVLSLFEGET